MSGYVQCPALLVSAPASGQGKSSVTAALARWHQRHGRRVRVFKTGPDFLDPMLLARASGAAVYQLDLWMCGEDDIRQRLHAAACVADLILIEGVMGLYDGAPSTADLAQRFDIPVLAVIDGASMAQTFGALAAGLARYRVGMPMHGVAANRIGSAHHARLLHESLPPELAWMGALPRDPTLSLPERHLGLVAAGEVVDLDARLDALADAWGVHANTELPPPRNFRVAAAAAIAPRLQGVRIAIARDAAFCFLYPANLELLSAAGAQLQFFSPLAGDALPDCDAVWLPGGYPELHLPTLSARQDLFAALHAHCRSGKPLLAECGGMLMLLRQLAGKDGVSAALAGLLPGEAALQRRSVALGLQEVTLPEGTLRGHTFHYARATLELSPLARARNPNGGPSAEAVYRLWRLTASFVHFYFPSNPEAAIALFRP